MLDQCYQSPFPVTLQPIRPKCFEEKPSHTLIWITVIGTGRLSGLPFMSSSFNARSAEPTSRHLHASRVAVLRCPHRAADEISPVACDHPSRLSSVLTEFPLAWCELDRFDARDIFGGRSI